jgi:hypothetical protein
VDNAKLRFFSLNRLFSMISQFHWKKFLEVFV